MIEVTSDRTVRASLLFLCFIAGLYALYATRNIIAPFALAVFFWLVIDGFATWLDKKTPRLPYSVALAFAIICVFMSMIGISMIVVDTATDMSHEAPKYIARISEIGDWITRLTGRDLDWSEVAKTLNIEETIQAAIVGFASAVRSVFSNLMIISIYVAFLFVAQRSFPKKMDDLFPDPKQRHNASHVGRRIAQSIEKYVGVQTVMSLIQTVLSYFVMVGFGLDNALFWAFVIFILNYIPIVGGFLAVIMPVLFAMIQFDSATRLGGMTFGLFMVQVVLNNTLQPKMMGDSMNLSPLTVVLSLTLWGALWGGVGAFLAAPLTVALMIILAQFKETRWIAILLSSDGHPDDDGNKAVKSGEILTGSITADNSLNS